MPRIDLGELFPDRRNYKRRREYERPRRRREAVEDAEDEEVGGVAVLPEVAALDVFEGEFDFLNIESGCEVVYEGRKYGSVFEAFLHVRGEKESDFGLSSEDLRSLRAREGWVKMGPDVLERLLRDKFVRNKGLRSSLLSTGSRILSSKERCAFMEEIESKDSGSVELLSRILMKIRKSIYNGTDLLEWMTINGYIETDKNLIPKIILTELKPHKNKILEHCHVFSGKSYYVVGKSADNDYMANHPSISRKHALFGSDKEGNGFVIDLGSTCGTYLNDSLIPAPFIVTKLQNGDLLRFAESSRKYKYHIDFANVIDYLRRKKAEHVSELKRLDSIIKDPTADALAPTVAISIRGFGIKTKEDDIINFFQNCGPVDRVQMLSSSKNIHDKLVGNAIIHFGTKFNIRKALFLDGLSIGGHPVKIEPHKERHRT